MTAFYIYLMSSCIQSRNTLISFYCIYRWDMLRSHVNVEMFIHTFFLLKWKYFHYFMQNHLFTYTFSYIFKCDIRVLKHQRSREYNNQEIEVIYKMQWKSVTFIELLHYPIPIWQAMSSDRKVSTIRNTTIRINRNCMNMALNRHNKKITTEMNENIIKWYILVVEKIYSTRL